MFNLVCNIYTAGTGPPDPPRVVNVPCQLYVNSRVALVFEPDISLDREVGAFLRCPWGTDIRENDIVQIPALISPMIWWYADDPLPVHAGFTNQYYVAHLVSTDGAVPLPSGGFILMEDGVSHILLESGPPDAILME